MKSIASLVFMVLALLVSLPLWAGEKSDVVDPAIQKNRFHNITLEMSLKPFKKNNEAYIREVASEVFIQWSALLRQTDTV